MTEVAFHFNVVDKLRYSCLLLRKSQRHGVALVVTGEPQQLHALDQALWSLAPTEFLAHSTDASPPAVQRYSALSLCTQPLATQSQQLLINLGQQVPPGYEQFQRLIEIVSADDAQDRSHARQRWKHYAQSGHPLVHHDIAQKRAQR